MSKLGRRVFLVAAGSAAVLAPYVAIKLRWGEAEEVVEAILRRRLGHLRLHPLAIPSFAREYIERNPEHRDKLQRAAVIAWPLHYLDIYPLVDLGHPLRRAEDNVVSMFLQSTDFFEHGADESRAVEYVAYYDPIETPCRNFLAVPPKADGTEG